MGLSHDIISEFVRITNDKKEKPKEGIVYGVVAQTSDGNYVKIDGSDLITPAETTTEVQDGERVTVMIKDHTATITGNVTSPSANSNSVNKKFESVSDKIGTFELIVADKISANELEVYKATIDVLIAGKATIQDLEVVNATIEHLYAQNATIENLVANKASIKDLDVVNATIENLKAKDAEIEHAVIDNLEATLADIKVLNADFAQIRTLVNGNLTSDNILSFNITSDKVTMEDAFIKDAMIANVSAAKINAGKINTNNVTIGSEDGGMLITGSTQQFVDKDGNVRIQIGRDAKGDFTFILYGEDGVGQLINQNGITASAISDGLIVNDMVSDKAAISGEKLDISSVIMEINNDNSTAIKSNKIYLNEQEQSLEVAFNSLKTQVETIKDITVNGDLTSVIDQVQANTTEIEVNKERINTLILEDSIIKKQVTDLEGDVVETSTTLASKYSELDQTIEGFKTSVADTYATKSTVNDISNNLSTNYSTTSAMNSAINQKVDEINLSISETYATNESVNDINDNLLKNYSTTSVMNSTINQKVDEIVLSVSETYATKSSVDGINDKLLTEYPTLTQMDSAITQTATEISSVVAKQEIQNTKIGGTNLLGSRIRIFGEYHIPSFVRTNATSFEVLGHMNNDGTVRISNIIDGNGWYTISFDVKCQIDGWHVVVDFCDGEIKLFNNISITDYTHCVYSYEVTNYTSDRYNFIDICGLSSQTFWFKNIKVERGKIATDYSPCPSDYSTTTQMNSAIQQKADSITSTVNSNYTTLNNKFSDYPTTTQMNSAIQQKADSITSTVNSNYTTLNNKFSDYPTKTQMNSAIQQKADSITSAVNMTKIGGVELLPQGYRRGNSTSGYSSISGGALNCNVSGLYTTERAFIISDYIAVDPNLPIAYEYDITNSGGAPLTYLGVEQFTGTKEEVSANAETIYFLETYFNGNKKGSGTLTLNSNTRYIRFRWLSDWESTGMSWCQLGGISLKQLGAINQSTKISQMSDSITSTVSSVNNLGSRMNTAESSIKQHANQIATKVDVNGVKSTIQQNPESVRIGFNGISDYFDLNSTRLKVGHSDGGYTRIGQDGILYQPANGGTNRYHCLMKQGWTETVSMSTLGANGWSLIVTLPPEFRGKVFSVIPCLTYVSCPNLADAIKSFEINIPQETVNYNQGSFVIYLYATGLWAEGLSIHYNVQIRMTWIAIA